MSGNKGIVTHISLYARLAKVGLVNTRLRVFNAGSLDAVYRVIEESALGTLSRKHFYFLLENDRLVVAAVPAYLVHYKSPESPPIWYGIPKLLKRRSFRRLEQALTTEAATNNAQALLLEAFGAEASNQAMIDGSKEPKVKAKVIKLELKPGQTGLIGLSERP